MTNSSNSSNEHKLNNSISMAILVFSFLGALDAMYLAAHHYLSTPLPCTLFSGCEVVTTSQYATIGPISIAIPGLLYYLTIFFGMLAYREFRFRLILRGILALVTVGVCFSAWLVYIQGWILHAWCQYCLFSAATTTILFVLTCVAFISTRPQQHK